MFNKISIALVAITILFFAVGGPQAEPLIDKQSLKVTRGGTLYLKSDMGSIEVESHNRDSVDVRVETKGDDADNFAVDISRDGDDVRVVGKRKKHFGLSRSSARFVVKVPQQYNVDLNTAGGSISVADLQGTVNAYTSGGSIDLGKIQGEVKVHTSGGSIAVDEVSGNIDAHTSGGSIKARLSEQPTDDCRLRTSGGSVTAYLAPSIAVDLDAKTSGGSVRSDIEVDGSVKKNRIRGKINGGGPKLELRTSGGSVRVRSL